MQAPSVSFLASRTLPAKSLELFFDYSCPYAYLASHAAPEVALRMGVRIIYRPFLLGGVFQARGTPQNLMAQLSSAKAAHNLRDMQRWASRRGVPLVVPPEHPRKTVQALRATLVCDADPKVIAGFFHAYWVLGQDPSALSTIAEVVTAAGYDAKEVLARIETAEIKDALRVATDRAIARGVFGAPTFFVDGTHLYWGQDRLAFVEGLPAPAVPSTTAGRGRVVEAFWDYSSPFAYLGMAHVETVAARTGAAVVSRPMLLGAVFKALGQVNVPIETFSPERRANVMADLERWAAHLNVPYTFPTRFPMSSLKALRATLLLPEAARRPFRESVFRAYWAEDRDISDEAVLGDLLGDAAPGVLPRLSDPAVKSELAAATQAALDRGVFGAPTFVVDGELYWGQDRLDFVEEHLTRTAGAASAP